MQVVKLDMTNCSHQCPPGTRLRTGLPKRLCGIGINGTGCSSTTFDVYGIEYSQVCGKIIGLRVLRIHLVKVNHQLKVPMWMVSVSLIVEIQESTFGHLLEALMRWVIYTLN